MTPLSNRGIDDVLTKTLKEAQDGDQVAWEKLFREYYPKVRRVVRRKLDRSMRSVYDSTDFASDVMKSLAANLSQLDFPSSEHLVAFLAQVAEQKVIDEYRRRRTLKRDVTRERPIDGGASESVQVQIASDLPTPSQFAQANEAEEKLLEERTEIERRIIRLRQEGHDNNDIADQTGWNIRKVQRFLKNLHDSIRGEAR
ncbi:RNA polymerase sigma factor [Paludisphaera mucosa]|uniref:Sigma-70 family RNA polymerase sigma factor n=1 Tax=Paludisphaera mucosa TaxID=3030827 RepID=A0ABT6FH23_9BACT|nr:sigma-70 family RNA polymerase sigma factor [Paludisphaera mucosa]MDG3006685.1 sigma-70 family RNA polymerase sigma factor [Paludisphaera mucosa]